MLLDSDSRDRYLDNYRLSQEAKQEIIRDATSIADHTWRRVRKWRGLAKFSSFLAVLARRLLTDYHREVCGHLQPPGWLKKMQDPLWNAAWRLLVEERYPWNEAVELLLGSYLERERWFIEEVVRTIRKKCPIEPQPRIVDVPEHEWVSPEREPMIKDKEMSEALSAYVQGEAPTNPRVCELLSRLREQLHLTEEDRLLLRLRYHNGLSIPAIARQLHLQGDLFKRMNKLIAELRRACQLVGFDLE